MQINDLIPLNEYAARRGLLPNTVRYKCIRGTLPGARKIGRDWFVPADAPYIDAKIKTGKYVGQRKKGSAE